MLGFEQEYNRKTSTVLMGIVIITLIAGYALLAIMLGKVKALACLPNNRETVLLVSVVDGDTIKVRHADGEINTVRYIGVDTPERGEPLFALATKENKALLANGHITLIRDVSATDKYGRLLRYVMAGDKDIGSQLLKSGYAKPLSIQPDTACSAYYWEIR